MQGGPILSGLKRPASGELVADSGTGKRSDDSAATRVAALLISAVAVARRSLGWLATRAVDRAITPGSLAGISVLMAVCAAGWFSGGAGEDGARGLLAMVGWLLFLLASRGLAGFAARGPAGQAGPGASGSGARPGGSGPGGTAAGDGDASAGVMLGFGWLAAISATAAESAIYGGMAAGTGHATLIGAWPLAVLTIASVALTDVLGACRAAALTAERSSELGRNPVMRAVGTLLRVPPGLRGLLALAAYGLGGPQAALLAVVGLGVVAIAAAVATLAMIVPAAGAATARPASPLPVATAARSGAQASARITAIVGVAGSRGETTAVQFTTTPSAAWLAASRGRPAPEERTAGERPVTAAAAAAAPRRRDVIGGLRDGGGAAAAAAARRRDVIGGLRDDGAAARWAGRLVQGNLIPLPPALAGLIATAMLAALGLHHLPGFIALTPPVVMMLAAPGSSHPHDSRFDWVVPVLLAAAQFVYIGSLGFALAVPGPVVFAACALVAIWYAGNTAIRTGTRGVTGQGAGASGAGSGAAWGPGMGWESRMFLIGLAATFGLATFGYVGLAAYLGVLICRRVVTGYLVPREEDRQ
ncbi:MAG TPA: hypothetical protein VF162_04290 [Streptosporangiaceae bacterium]